MFSIVDTFLINVAQWSVRQIELFTPCTRKDVGRIILLTLWCIVIFGIWLCQVLTSYAPINALTVIITLIGANTTYGLFKIFSQQKVEDGSLPAEKIERMGRRCATVVSLYALFTSIIFLTLWNYHMTKMDEEDRTMIFWGISQWVCIFFCGIFEYFLCTIGLPPAKKRKSVERVVKSILLKKV